MSEKPFKSFSTESGPDNPVERETAVIWAKPKEGRIDEETISIIRNRLAVRLEDQWTDPTEISWAEPDILDKLRSGQKIKTDREKELFVAQLLQEYRLDPDERDGVKKALFEE